uniref:Germin-like protein n=2 Tax=Cajanus cajan TaxID=3821 RepID=A0A151S6X9_CAJCA|nr:Auxin-binding protein ABP19b [Cajanus cajan]
MPGLNGQGIGLARAELVPGGMFGMHTHPGACELIIVEKGEITVGFMSSREAYVKTLKVGDVIAIPRGLLHFVLNTGNENGTITAFYGSENPTFQYLGNQLFGTDVASDIIAQTTPIDMSQVIKQKALFGGTG